MRVLGIADGNLELRFSCCIATGIVITAISMCGDSYTPIRMATNITPVSNKISEPILLWWHRA